MSQKKIKDTKEYTLSSDGRLEYHPDPYKGITEEELRAAEELEQYIQEQRGVVETSYIKIGATLDKFIENKFYRARGYTSFKQWADAPEVNFGYSQANLLLRIVRKALPVLQKHDAIDAINSVSIMKLLLPVLTDGEEKFVEAAYAVQGLTVKDAREKIKEIRGLPTDQALTPMFAAKVREVNDGYDVTITRTDTQVAYDVTRRGPIYIKKDDWPIWESRFGRLVEHEI